MAVGREDETAQGLKERPGALVIEIMISRISRDSPLNPLICAELQVLI